MENMQNEQMPENGKQESDTPTRNQYSGSGDFGPGPEVEDLQNEPTTAPDESVQEKTAKQKTAAATDPDKLDKI